MSKSEVLLDVSFNQLLNPKSIAICVIARRRYLPDRGVLPKPDRNETRLERYTVMRIPRGLDGHGDGFNMMVCIFSQSTPAPSLRRQLSFSNEHGAEFFQTAAVWTGSQSRDSNLPAPPTFSKGRKIREKNCRSAQSICSCTRHAPGRQERPGWCHKAKGMS